MPSLQKPRKITVLGSDNRSYSFLCKPKDDLRKDARLMEFNSMINKLLQRDSESRRRRLCSYVLHLSLCRVLTSAADIRTYSVVPLNEECGLIEWVPNTVALRGILAKLYDARGIAIWVRCLIKTSFHWRGPDCCFSRRRTSRKFSGPFAMYQRRQASASKTRFSQDTHLYFTSGFWNNFLSPRRGCKAGLRTAGLRL
jgi:Phosphatidylinositol 3- and 4-kinase